MTVRPRLLVLDDTEGRIESAPAADRLRELADVRFLDRPIGDVPDAELRGVQVVLAIRERTRFDAATLARLPDLELVLQTGGHAYHVDADAARERGIVIALGRRGTTARAAVPELTFALMIACMRRFPEAGPAMAAGEWPALTGRCLAGRRLGLLGTGRHGTAVARIAEAFGMQVAAWRRPGIGGSDTTDGPDPIVRHELDTILQESDVLSIHLRLSEESRGLLGAPELARCKPGAVLVNTARGAIVDEEALVGALRDGPLAAAGLDVFTEEPLPAASPLRSLPNVVLTPHVGWTVEEVFDEFAEITAGQLAGYLSRALDPDDLFDPEAANVVRDRCGAVAGIDP